MQLYKKNGSGKTLGNRQGFSLLETLVAVMVLGIVLVVIFQLFSGALKAGDLSERNTRALFHAKEKMEEILLSKELYEKEAAGEFESGYSWESRVDYIEPEVAEPTAGAVDLFQVTVRVSWGEGLYQKHTEISTLTIAKRVLEDM